MLTSYKDDGGKTIAYRPYRTSDQKNAALVELMRLAGWSEGRWEDRPPKQGDMSDPLGQRGYIGFVVRVDQPELLLGLREKLLNAARTAKTGKEFSARKDELISQVAPWNYDAMIAACDGVVEIFNARFPKPVGRIGFMTPGGCTYTDFDALKITSEGVTYSHTGDVMHCELQDVLQIHVHTRKAKRD